MSETVTGGCLCGKIKYTFDKTSVISAHHCHCTDCQKSTGCGKATIVIVPSPAMNMEGELKKYMVQGEGGSHVSRGFCEHCGSPVMSFIEEAPAITIVKAGSLDDSSWIEINSSFWSDTAQVWAPVDASCPASARNPEAL